MRTRKSEAMNRLERVNGGPLALGKALEAIRLGEEESLAAFAKKLGVSRAHLCDIEKGRKIVSPARAARFAQLLGYGERQFVRLALQDELAQAGLRFKVDLEAA
jgi:antitoxin HigA-1